MKGENFTSEYKYPIKIYRIGQSVEFSNGLELRKLIFSIILAAAMIMMFIVVGVKSDSNIVSFIFKNWLILITVIPGVISFVVFNLHYDNKGFIAYFKDRWNFYRERKKSYEHFIEVPVSQMKENLSFEPFINESSEGEKDE